MKRTQIFFFSYIDYFYLWFLFKVDLEIPDGADAAKKKKKIGRIQHIKAWKKKIYFFSYFFSLNRATSTIIIFLIFLIFYLFYFLYILIRATQPFSFILIFHFFYFGLFSLSLFSYFLLLSPLGKIWYQRILYITFLWSHSPTLPPPLFSSPSMLSPSPLSFNMSGKVSLLPWLLYVLGPGNIIYKTLFYKIQKLE